MLQIDTLPPYTTLADTTADSLHTLCAYDTIFTPVGRIEPVLHKSLFTHHLLPVENTHEIAIQHQGSPGWPLIFIALSITLICIFLRNKQIGILDLLHSAIDSRAMDRTLRDSNLTHATDQAIIAPLMLLPVVLIAYFSYAPRLANIWFDILTFLLSLLAACVVYYSRNGIIRLCLLHLLHRPRRTNLPLHPHRNPRSPLHSTPCSGHATNFNKFKNSKILSFLLSLHSRNPTDYRACKSCNVFIV